MADKHEEALLRFTLAIEEYKVLKEEQRARIGFRDNMVFVNLMATGSLGGFALSSITLAPVLLLIPWVNGVLGWTYVCNDRMVTRITDYISDSICAQIDISISFSGKEALGWERGHRVYPFRHRDKLVQTCVDLLTFCVPGTAGLVLFLRNQSFVGIQTWHWVAFFLGCVLNVFVASRLVLLNPRLNASSSGSESQDAGGNSSQSVKDR